MSVIVDSHTHLGDFPLFNVRLDADSMIKLMDEYNIEKSIVFSLPNELTLKAVQKYPERLAGLVWVNPHRGDEAIKLIDKAVIEWNFKGIKLHPLLDSYLPDQEIVDPIMERARKHGIPVLFHCGHPPWSLPWHFSPLADRFPDVTIILGHMGHGHIVYINGAIEIAKKHENIMLETSGMPMHSKIKEAAEVLGPERILYGSDMPFGHPAFELEKVRVSGLSRRELELVLGENALRVFKLK
ncbi:MAG: amidohydrolase family protein [archaeon GB-1867-005]|nr:amidohydrolase family protein [Candidatus Culexmicrobium cathedralense]